jgi:hypothetical protein
MRTSSLPAPLLPVFALDGLARPPYKPELDFLSKAQPRQESVRIA